RAKALAKNSTIKALIALCILALPVALLMRHKAPLPLSADAQAWQASILKNGSEKAYQKFAESVEGQESGNAHAAAHSFGSALYEVKGGSGFPICRDLFSYGCVHGFI